MRKKRVLFSFGLMLLTFAKVWAQGVDYSAETKAFLSARDPRIQARQIKAIRRATAGDNSRLVKVRAARNELAPLPEGVEAIDVNAHARLYRPLSKTSSTPLLIYLHGGGWVIGSIASCSRFCGAVAAKGVAVLALDYPLAPEHPFPAALDFVVASYTEAEKSAAKYGYNPKRIFIGGDSSGGNLALTAAFQLKKAGKVPAGLILYYPVTAAWADESASWKEYATGWGMDAAFMDACNEAYLQGHDDRDPLVSPLKAEEYQLKALPPVFILAADCDVLRDQGRAFVKRLKAFDKPVVYECPKGTTHLYVTVPGQSKAFERAVQFALEACESLDQ